MPEYYWTSEFVSSGHPDKVADQVADAILDAHLADDPNSKVAVEVTITGGFVLVTGEVASEAKPDIEHIVRQTIANIGYDRDEVGFNAWTCEVMNRLRSQSPEINKAVGEGGAGDQGMMFGFACNDTHCYMPPAIYLAREIIAELEHDRRHNPDSPLLPDAKSQVTLELDGGGKLLRVDTIVISACHKPRYSLGAIREYVQRLVCKDMFTRLPEAHLVAAFDGTELHINPGGEWTIGGPAADTGLSGRKIVCDQYGADCPVGGGSFSGKDPTKVDRSAAYAARHIAKNLLVAQSADRAQVLLSFGIGMAEPTSIFAAVTRGGEKIDFSAEVCIHCCSRLTPTAIIERLGLRKPIYLPTASGGHFGREPSGDLFTWERLDLVEEMRNWKGAR